MPTEGKLEMDRFLGRNAPAPPPAPAGPLRRLWSVLCLCLLGCCGGVLVLALPVLGVSLLRLIWLWSTALLIGLGYHP